MKKVLVVVDYQNDFVSGALGFPGAEKLEIPIAEKIRSYRTNEDTVVFTYDTHREDYLSTVEGKKLPVVHCVQGTQGWELFGSLRELAKDSQSICFCKETFGSMNLAEYLKNNAFSSVELVGLVSNICVLSNAVLAKAALPEAEILVDASCTASADPILHEKALDVLEGIHITVCNRREETKE